jgi:hypothetical protein
LDNCRKAVADFNSWHPDTATKHQRRKRQKWGLAFSLRGFLTRPGGRMHSRIRVGKFSLFSKKRRGMMLWAHRACHVQYVSRAPHCRPVRGGDPSILPILQSTSSDQDP